MTRDPSEIKGFELLQNVAAQALDDDDYKQRLLADPRSVLTEAGLVIPEGVELIIHENTQDTIHLVLPVQAGDAQEVEMEEVDVSAILPLWPF